MTKISIKLMSLTTRLGPYSPRQMPLSSLQTMAPSWLPILSLSLNQVFFSFLPASWFIAVVAFTMNIHIHLPQGTLPVEVSDVCQSCGVSPVWLLYLCIAFGILFLVMLVINVFLCSAMTCSCSKHSKEEKEASYLEDFDPYARSWQGSQYGSRLNF